MFFFKVWILVKHCSQSLALQLMHVHENESGTLSTNSVDGKKARSVIVNDHPSMFSMFREDSAMPIVLITQQAHRDTIFKVTKNTLTYRFECGSKMHQPTYIHCILMHRDAITIITWLGVWVCDRCRCERSGQSNSVTSLRQVVRTQIGVIRFCRCFSQPYIHLVVAILFSRMLPVVCVSTGWPCNTIDVHFASASNVFGTSSSVLNQLLSTGIEMPMEKRVWNSGRALARNITMQSEGVEYDRQHADLAITRGIC